MMRKGLLILSFLMLLAASGRTAALAQEGAASGTVLVERVLVTGNVANPQEVLFSPRLTLTRALAWAGGALAGSDMKRVKISRDNGTKDGSVFFVNLKAIRDRKEKDLILRPYDIVCVPDKKSGGANCNMSVLRRPKPELPSRVIY